MTTKRSPNLSKKTDKEIDQWIHNHEHARATDVPLYKELLEERARRSQGEGHLEIEKSLSILARAAKEERFVTYGDLAKASGVPWSIARHRLNGAKGHLDRLVDVCHARGLPQLSAICVNESGRKTGELESNALSGFIAAARRVGFLVADERAFHRQACNDCFEWGRGDKK